MDKAWKSFYVLKKTGGIKELNPPHFKQDNIPVTYMQMGIRHEKGSDQLRLSLPKDLKSYVEETYGICEKFLYLENKIFRDMDRIKQLRVYPPENETCDLIVIYEMEEPEQLSQNGHYLSIDLGLHNLMTCYDSGNGRTFILGRKYLSLERYFHKEIARVQSVWYAQQSERGIKYPKSSKHIQRLYRKKQNTVKDYLHKVTRWIAEKKISVLCAQYFGKGNLDAIHAIEGITLRFSLAISGIVALLAFTVPQYMMQLFTADPELIAIGSSYLRVMGITYLCWGVTEVYLSILRSVGRVTASMVLNVLAFGLNIILNATFIFGLFGAPRLGAVGVAIATASSRAIELIGCFIVSVFSKDVKLNLTYIFIRSKVLLKDFIRLSLPALGNDVSWSVGFAMYSVILGHLSTDVVAANSLVTVVRNIGSVFCFAIASAGTILLGNIMGKGDMEKSREYAARMLKMTVIAGAAGGLIVLAVTPFVLHFASLNENAMYYLKIMLLINTYYIMGSAVNTALIAGVFRAGGDTRFGLICDTIDMWCYAVPLGFFAAFVLKLPVLWVYFLLCTDEFVKWPWEKWQNH